MKILEIYFSFENEAEALDFIYSHLDTELKQAHYETVDLYLKNIMDNIKWWKKGIDLPIFSLAFAIWTNHEPNKFKNREEFINRLYTDYVSTHGVLKADRLLVGLKKGITMPQIYDNKKT